MPAVFVSAWIKGSFTRLHECVLLCFVAARKHTLCKIDTRNFHLRCLTGEMKYQCFLLTNVCIQHSCAPKSADLVYSLKSCITLGGFPHIASSYSGDYKAFYTSWLSKPHRFSINAHCATKLEGDAWGQPVSQHQGCKHSRSPWR